MVKNFHGKNILPVVVCPPLDFMRLFTVLRNALRITVQKSWNMQNLKLTADSEPSYIQQAIRRSTIITVIM